MLGIQVDMIIRLSQVGFCHPLHPNSTLINQRWIPLSQATCGKLVVTNPLSSMGQQTEGDGSSKECWDGE